jgi:D-alanyl-lipoteichoic acid acyltransferase DltB (MBOAT superfamily)
VGSQMTEIVATFVGFLLIFTAIGSLLSLKQFKLFAPIFGAAIVLYIAPFSLLWMTCLLLLGWCVMQKTTPTYKFGSITLLSLVGVTLAFLILRELDWLTSLGAAYFTLRVIHITVDTRFDVYEPPALSDLVIYMLYPPVFLVGPIHRYPNFKRQFERRRVSADGIAIGAERVLLGLFMTIFVGGYLLRKIFEFATQSSIDPDSFAFDWMMSAIGWVDLYFIFAGLSSVAVGCSLIVGIKIEENFNAPYCARDLVDFWGRWHMSLTSWCRDYVYKPLASFTRLPVLGVLFAMLVLGLWHETSYFYVGWSIWQAVGIVLSRFLKPVYARLPNALDIAISPILILGWLSLANPVVTALGDLF